MKQQEKSQRPPAKTVTLILAAVSSCCLAFTQLLAAYEQADYALALHSEQSVEDFQQDYSYSQAVLESEQAEEHWLLAELRSLKRGGSSSSSKSSSSKSRSYGNCYGDRCDDTGGDADVAIIIGCIVGGCCLLLCIYMLVVYCQKKQKKAAKKARRKNKVGHSNSDSDMPREPIVIHEPNDAFNQDHTTVNTTQMPMQMPMGSGINGLGKVSENHSNIEPFKSSKHAHNNSRSPFVSIAPPPAQFQMVNVAAGPQASQNNPQMAGTPVLGPPISAMGQPPMAAYPVMGPPAGPAPHPMQAPSGYVMGAGLAPPTQNSQSRPGSGANRPGSSSRRPGSSSNRQQINPKQQTESRAEYPQI